MIDSDIATLVISVCAILLSFASFFYSQVRKGHLVFWRPNTYLIYRIPGPKGVEGNLVIAFPVCATNTGAVTHSINYLHGILISMDRSWQHPFRMNTEWEEMYPPKVGDKTQLASTFGVPPNDTATRIMSFTSNHPQVQLGPGTYEFRLVAVIDGQRKGNTSRATFKIEFTEEHLERIAQGAYVGSTALYDAEIGAT